MILIILRILLVFAVVFFLTRLVRVIARVVQSSNKPGARVPPRRDGKSPINPHDIVDGRWEDMKD